MHERSYYFDDDFKLKCIKNSVALFQNGMSVKTLEQDKTVHKNKTKFCGMNNWKFYFKSLQFY